MKAYPQYSFYLFMFRPVRLGGIKKKGPAFEEPCPIDHSLVGREGIEPSTY